MRHRLFEGRLVAYAADDMIVHFDAIDQRADIGLPEGGFSGGDVVAHDAAERINQSRVERARARLRTY